MENLNLLSGFKHRTKIQIRFKDIDVLGHVNNANHLTYFEIARTHYFNEVFRKKNDWQETGLILAKVEVTYKLPILLEDNLYCYTKITRFGGKSFDVESLLVNETESEKYICAHGKSIIVSLNYNTKQTITVPKVWVESVKAYEY